MIKFNMSEPNLRKAMGISDKDIRKALDILVNSKDNTLVWLIQRIWIDETLEENIKCFMVFHLGVLWNKFNQSKEIKGNDPWWN